MRAFTGRYPNLSLNGSEITIRFVFLFLCLFFSFISFGQIKFENLAANKDLSSKCINDIVQDSRGFLLIATNNGLYQFDGYTINKFRYDPSDSSALNELVLTKIFKESSGDIWIGGHSLYHFNNLNEHFDSFNLNLPIQERISDIFQYDPDNLIIVSSQIGIFNLRTKKYIEFYLPLINQINHAILDTAKNIWITDNEGKVFRFEITDVVINKSYSYSLNYKASCIYQSTSGKILLGTSGGIILEYDMKTNTFLQDKELSKMTEKVNEIFDDKSGNLWIVTQNGLYLYNNYLHKMEFYTADINDPNALNSNHIYCICNDKYGILWIGTENGLCSVNPNTKHITYFYRKPDNSNSVPSNLFFSIYRDDKNVLWLSTENGILSVVPEKHTVKRYLFDLAERKSKQILFNYSINQIKGFQDYLLTAGVGLNKINFERNIYQYAFPEEGVDTSIPGWLIRRIVNGQVPGTFLVATSDGIAKFSIKNTQTTSGIQRMPEAFHRFILDSDHHGINNFYTIWDVFEDKQGQIWLGTDRGLFSFDPVKKNLIKYPIVRNSKITQDYVVRCIYQDKNSNLWIGSEGFGLNKVIKDSSYLKNINVFPRDVVWGILEDTDSNLWISTCKGLIKYNQHIEDIRVYDESDGLLSEEFIADSYYKDNEGRMYFGSIGGLISFFPKDIESNKTVPDVWINELFVFNKLVGINEKINGNVILVQSLTFTKKIDLSYKDKVISFGFTGIHMQSPKNNRFAYCLIGFDKNWNYTNSETRKANYTNLPAGDYSFRVKAANADGDVYKRQPHS